MREGSITSTPMVSESGSVTNSEGFMQYLLEQPKAFKTLSGIKPHSVAPLTNLFDPLSKSAKMKQKSSIKNEIQKRDNFVQHRSLLKKSALTKRLRAATISSYSYSSKAPGV